MLKESNQSNVFQWKAIRIHFRKVAMLVLKLDKDGCCCVVCFQSHSHDQLSKPLDYSPRLLCHEIFQAGILEVSLPFLTQGSCKDQNYVSCCLLHYGQILHSQAIGSPQGREIHTKKKL